MTGAQSSSGQPGLVAAATSRIGGGQSAAPQLRPYQLAADAAITHELETLGRRSTLLVQATGTGKTVAFLERARRVRSRGGRVLILAHRDELIQQPRRKLEALGIIADIEKGKQRASLNARMVIASVQSLRGPRLARFARDHFDLVIADEAHHSVSPGWRAILDHFDSAKVLGVTATPDRADGKALGEVFESVACRYEIRQAIADGYLVPIVARRIVVESVDLSTVATRAGDFAPDQLAAVMETERAIRGVVTPLLELSRDRPTVVFGVDVAHAELLADRINELRPGAARSLSGETDAATREHLLEGFAAGEFQYLCNCDVLTEGWDCPTCSCVALAAPTKSRGRYVQRAGRGTRPSPETGKRDLLLLDFTGTAGRHRLAGPVDCLAGSEQGMDAFADDLRAELDRLLGTQQLELESVLARADAEVAYRRRALAIDAVVKFHAESIDPFLGAAPADRERSDTMPAWEGRSPTEAQLRALDRAGITLSKLPEKFSMADASRLLTRLAVRRNSGLCSLAQAKAISRAGIPTEALSFSRAVELCTMLRLGGWRPSALHTTPEYIAAAGARPHDLVRLSATADEAEMAAAAPVGAFNAPDRADAMAEHEALP